MKKKKKSTYYVTNADLLPEMKKFRETGIASEELGRMLMKIANNLSNSGNFAGYSWKRDMVSEALLTCIKYSKNFDPEKGKNPFAYLTQICRHTFINFTKKQKRHSVIKDQCYKGADKFTEKHGDHFACKGINYELLVE